MALTESPPEIDEATAVAEPLDDTHRTTEPTAFERIVGSGDHRVLGRILVGASLLFLVVDLVISGLVDLDTATSQGVFRPDVTERLLLNHQLGLLLIGVLPLLLGIAYCVVPTQLGSPSIAFPRAAAAAVWTWLGSAIVFIVAVAADGGYGGGSVDAARLGNVATGALIVSLLLGVICVAVSVLTLRPMGMSLGDVPFFSFSMLAASAVWVLSFPAALAHVALGQISHSNANTLATATFGRGLAWTLIQPAVYVVFIPVLGIAVDVAATAVAGRQRYRGAVQGAIGFFALLSYGAWAQTPAARSTLVWVAVTLAAALPLLAVLGSIGDTLRQGRPSLMSPLAFSVLALLLALLGAGVGLVQTINTFGHGTLADFSMNLLDGPQSLQGAQLRLLVGAAAIGGLGAVFYWGRQICGTPLADGPGKGIAPLAALGVALWGVPPLIQALATTDHPDVFAGISAAGAAVLLLAVLGTLGGLVRSAATSGRGDTLLADVWSGGGTLEWAEPAAGPITVESPYPVLDTAGKDAS
jgi:heme/copper-type cytochrome/quinol oxidase subunit 1